MIVIHTALHLEAKKFIAEYKLKRVMDYPGYEYYRHQDIALLISGIGKMHAAAAISGLLTYLSINKQDLDNVHIVNIGLAGATSDYKISKLYLIKEIKDNSSETSYYPDLILKSNLEQVQLRTFDQAVKQGDYQLEKTLVDMEASGFFTAASKYIAPHQIHCLKIVADHLSTDFYDKDTAAGYYQENFKEIDQYIDSLKTCYPNVLEDKNDDDLEGDLEKIIIDLKLSKAQQKKLIEVARQYQNITKEPITNFLEGYHYRVSEHKQTNSKTYEKLVMKLEIEIQKMFSKSFDTIYLETDAKQYSKTEEIIKKFPRADLIEIESYQEIFNRNRQDFRAQKNSPKLILAVKHDGFIYKVVPILPIFGYEHFYYNAMILNCIYDCSYCYLQGMFNSANLVVFVNHEDFTKAALDKLQELKSLYLAISYDTDLMAFENITGYCSHWIDLCREHPNLLVESRTKSVNFKAISQHEALDNFILAWTLSPDEITEEFEQITPSMSARLNSIKSALEAGWPVRLCLDPLLLVNDWKNIYSKFVKKLAEALDPHSIKDISIGTFRMNQAYYKKITKMRSKDWLYNYPYQSNDGIISYKDQQKSEIEEFVSNNLTENGFSQEQIHVF